MREARGAWDQLLAGIAALEAIEPRLGGGEAVGLLARTPTETPFQPESAVAPIQILGLLEAVGLPFDALWVTGMAADAWPPAPQPNPLLPLAWQRERDVPHADAARELAYARRLTDRLLRGAPEVVFSGRSGSTIAPDCARRCCRRWPRWRTGCPPRPDRPGRGAAGGQRMVGAVDIEAGRHDASSPPCRDWTRCATATRRRSAGPPLTTGSRVIVAQSECPFQALANVRWDAEPWPPPLTGLSAGERGTLVHDGAGGVLARVRTQARLLELVGTDRIRGTDRRGRRRRRSGAGGRAAPELPAVVLAGEAQRLARTLRDWLAASIAARPPFDVRGIETDGTLEFPGLDLRLRFDRVDALDDGGVALIDYKSGSVAAPGKWFEYASAGTAARALRAGAACRRARASVRAVAYAQLKPGEVKAVGSPPTTGHGRS